MSAIDLPPPGGRLLALLCNPPLGEASSTTTGKCLWVLKDLLRADLLETRNLISRPSANTRCIPVDALPDAGAWREELYEAAEGCDVVLAAWGTFPPRGWPKASWAHLERVTYEAVLASGHSRVLQVGGSTRHPSRWRQHTSPIHGRYAGESFEERLKSALSWHPVSEAAPGQGGGCRGDHRSYQELRLPP